MNGDPFPEINDWEFDHWERLALSIVDSMIENPDSLSFRDCATENTGISWARIEDYPGIVMQPTDLNTIKAKLERFEYKIVD